MPEIIYKEKTLPSGEIMVLTDQSDNVLMPWIVEQIDTDGETVRWTKYFTTREEAEKEYIRFD